MRNDDLLFNQNPAKDYVNCISDYNINMIEIFNMSGQLTKTLAIGNTNQTTIDILDLNEGIYVLRVYTDSKIQSSLLKVIR